MAYHYRTGPSASDRLLRLSWPGGGPLAPFLAFGVGVALLTWLAAEIAIVDYSNNPPLQAIYLALGVVIALVGIGWLRQTRSRRPRSWRT